MNSKLLYVEDEPDLGNVTRQYLELMDFEVEWCTSGGKAFELFDQDPDQYNLIIIDIQLPDMDGFELAKLLLHVKQNAYFLFLTARNEKSDRLRGLQIGADDYISKPFDIEELVLRMRNILKRKQLVTNVSDEPATDRILKVGDVELHKDLLRLSIADKKLDALTQREAELLEYLIKHQNRILKREDILVQLWGENDYFLGRSLDVFISRLRKLLRSSSCVKIENIYGVGFIFDVS